MKVVCHDIDEFIDELETYASTESNEDLIVRVTIIRDRVDDATTVFVVAGYYLLGNVVMVECIHECDEKDYISCKEGTKEGNAVKSKLRSKCAEFTKKYNKLIELKGGQYVFGT